MAKANAGDLVRPLLEVRGNLVLVDELYRAVAALEDKARIDAASAPAVERKLESFLRASGYELARVSVTYADGHLVAEVDEGRLSKIVLRGRSPAKTLGLRISLDLPHDVFNRPELERQLERMGASKRDGRFDYELVPVQRVEHIGPQLDPSTLLPGQSALPVNAKYELHINLGDPLLDTGPRVEAGIDPDSARVGGGYRGQDLVVGGDLWDVGAQVGANFFDDLEGGGDHFEFSRVVAEARWYTPDLGFGLRPFVGLREDLIRRQRQDLGVSLYLWNRLEGSANLALQLRRYLELSFGLGVQQRNLFAVDQLAAAHARAPAHTFEELRAFVDVSTQLVFDPQVLRSDRRHRLELSGRYFVPSPSRSFWQAQGRYRKVVEFGWNDLWLGAAGSAIGGAYAMADATPMTGQLLRGVFGHAYYLERGASAYAAFRLSLARDVYKVGVFHEASVFATAPSPLAASRTRLGNSFGPSFHALIMDVLELDIFYAFGFVEPGQFDHGVSMRLERAF